MLLCPCSFQATCNFWCFAMWNTAINFFQVVIQLNGEDSALVINNNIVWKLVWRYDDVVSWRFHLWARVFVCISSERQWILFLVFTLTAVLFFLQSITWIVLSYRSSSWDCVWLLENDMAGAISLCCDGHKFSGSWESKFLFWFNAMSLKKSLLTRHTVSRM